MKYLYPYTSLETLALILKKELMEGRNNEADKFERGYI